MGHRAAGCHSLARARGPWLIIPAGSSASPLAHSFDSHGLMVATGPAALVAVRAASPGWTSGRNSRGRVARAELSLWGVPLLEGDMSEPSVSALRFGVLGSLRVWRGPDCHRSRTGSAAGSIGGTGAAGWSAGRSAADDRCCVGRGAAQACREPGATAHFRAAPRPGARPAWTCAI